MRIDPGLLMPMSGMLDIPVTSPAYTTGLSTPYHDDFLF